MHKTTKSLLVSSNLWKNDFLLHQIFLVLSEISEVVTISPDSSEIKEVKLNKSSEISILFSSGGLLSYLYFSFIIRPKVKIYYVRELLPEKKKFNPKLHLYHYLEKIACKYSDLVITGNDYRRKIIESNYSVKPRNMFVWLNMRKLTESNEYGNKISDYNKKYEILLNKKICLFTSGYSLWRETDKIILQKKNLPNDYVFVIVGGNMVSKSSQNEYLIVQNLIKDNEIEGVHFFDKVEQDELLYLIRKAYLGIVHYNQIDLNNKYCSSGKLYEFVFENIPVVTTTNPPLKDFLNTFLLGVASENISSAIKEIGNNYDYFKKNLILYNSRDNLTYNNSLLSKKIIEFL